ncbi:MAG: SHOCT domain-containing protein [Pseudomonadota bacterium]
MAELTADGHRITQEISQRHGFSAEAVTSMLSAVAAGGGTQAQFTHPEFGGMGQWSSGGMIMIGDMFNTQLAGRVSSLCQELSSLVHDHQMFAPPPVSQSQSQGGGWSSPGSGTGVSLFVQAQPWWPGDLGAPASTGGQNDLRYAYFPEARRLAIEIGGRVTTYDTGEHQIGAFSQQQSGDQTLTFTSQFGVVRVSDLPVVAGGPPAHPMTVNAPEETPLPQPLIDPPAPSGAGSEVFELIEKLADLHAKGILNDAEFETKKSELLARL